MGNMQNKWLRGAQVTPRIHGGCGHSLHREPVHKLRQTTNQHNNGPKLGKRGMQLEKLAKYPSNSDYTKETLNSGIMQLTHTFLSADPLQSHKWGENIHELQIDSYVHSEAFLPFQNMQQDENAPVGVMVSKLSHRSKA